MFHKKRFRSTIVIILTLLLVVALAPIASAQADDEPPSTPSPDDAVTATPGPNPDTDPGTDPPPATSTPPANGTPPATGTPEPTATTMPDEGPMMSSSHSWPPPNAIVKHAATPIQISSHGGALNVYLIGPDGAVTSGPVLASFSALAEMHPSGDAVSLFSGTNTASGKSVMIDYLPDEKKIRVSTYYADKPPHDYNKPYVFTVNADHKVTHELW